MDRPDTHAGESRWRLTNSGRRALEVNEFCPCEIRLSGIMLTCTMCGTVYGAAREMKRPKAQRWTKVR